MIFGVVYGEGRDGVENRVGSVVVGGEEGVEVSIGAGSANDGVVLVLAEAMEEGW